MSDTTAPTCEQLWNEELGDPVSVEDDTSWRHGFHRHAVYHRGTDNTFWMAYYAVSTDGETNEFREGSATISQVYPWSVTTVEYKDSPCPQQT